MEAEKCVIREADDADLPRLAQLYRDFLDETMWDAPGVTPNPDFNVEWILTRMLRKRDSDVLVAETGDDLVGFACVDFRRGTDTPPSVRERLQEFFTRRRARASILFADHGCLAYLFVAKAYRRRGLGAALVGASGEWVKKRGGRSLDLNVLAGNRAAREFYGKLGMSELLVHYRMEL